MTPLTALADATDIYTARNVMETLRKAGYIIVDKGAIGRAQREANAEADEWRDVAFKRGELLDAIGREVWEPVAERLAARKEDRREAA